MLLEYAPIRGLGIWPRKLALMSVQNKWRRKRKPSEFKFTYKLSYGPTYTSSSASEAKGGCHPQSASRSRKSKFTKFSNPSLVLSFEGDRCVWLSESVDRLSVPDAGELELVSPCCCCSLAFRLVASGQLVPTVHGSRVIAPGMRRTSVGSELS